MAFCSFDDGAAMYDATPIENLFLMEYMYDTPPQALKVYLYARMLALHPELGGSTADMAKALRLTEDEVLRAFDYWERRELVCKRSDVPPTYALLPLRAQTPSGSALEQEIYANRDFNLQLQKLFGDNLIDRRDLNRVAEWVNILRYDKDAVVRLVQYGIQTSRVKNPKPGSVFERLKKKVEEWSTEDVHTVGDVERMIARESGATALARDVLKKLGKKRQPTEAELEAVRRWTEEWGYDREAILAACDNTLSAQNPSFGYLDSMLKNQLGELSQYFAAAEKVLRALNPQHGMPTEAEKQWYRGLLDGGYSPEMILLAAVQCRKMNKHTVDDLEWRLNLWRSEGLSTAEEASAYTKQMATLSRQLREVYARAGYEDRSPNPGAIRTYGRWRDSYPADLILFAAECARNHGGSMAYMEKLLTQWAKDGATTVEAAKARHAAWQAENGEKNRLAPANPALDYSQREYRDEDFNDDFYFDYEKVFGSEEKQS